MRMIALFRENRICGWRRHYKIDGKPDFVFPQKRLAIFVDGCFWHGHDCRNTKPKSNVTFWQSKLEYNKLRDKNITQTLRQHGWNVIRVWECELRGATSKRKLNQIKRLL